MIEFLSGLIVGTIGAYLFMMDRITDLKHHAQARLSDYKDFMDELIERHDEGFRKAFESQHGYTPFVNKAAEVVSTEEEDFGEDEVDEEEENYKRERWDD